METRAVVLAHSSASSGRQWAGVARELGSRWRVVAPDLSVGGAAGALEEDVAIVSAAIEAAGDRAHLVGHSYGGAVALLAALRAPHAVASLVVHEPVVFWLLRDDARGAGEGASASERAWREISILSRGLANDHAAGRTVDAARDFVDYWAGRGAWASLPEAQQRRIALRMPSVLANFADIGREATPLAALARLPMPVMWLGGATPRRPIVRLAELVGQALPQAVRYTLPGVGHMGPVSHPGLVASLVDGFAGAQAARRAARPLRRAA